MQNLTPEYMADLKAQLMETIGKQPLGKQFNMRLARPDTWIIQCYNPSADCPCPHVLIGDDYAMLIDPTETKYDLRRYIAEFVTDKPIKVLCTHSHLDHTLSNGQFNDCEIFMSEQAWLDIQLMREKDWSVPRYSGHIKGDYVPIIIKPGDILNLGNREIEVLEYNPCHSPSSLIYLDKKYGILFTGDEIDPGQVIMWNIPVETFRKNMLSLKKRADEFDMICAPHNGTPMHAQILDYFIENCDRIMSGVEGEMDKGSTSFLLNPFEPRSPEQVASARFDPNTRRSVWKGTALIYNVNLIFEK